MTYSSEEKDYEVYCPVTPLGGQASDFFLPRSDTRIRDHICMIVDGEGPVLKSIVVRRVADIWGIRKLDNKVKSRIHSLFPRSISANGAEGNFVWHEARISPKTYHFRGASFYPCSRRKVHEVCLEELGNVALYVLENVVELTAEELTRRVCRVIGTSSSELARERVNRALRIDFIRNEIRINDDIIKPSSS